MWKLLFILLIFPSVVSAEKYVVPQTHLVLGGYAGDPTNCTTLIYEHYTHENGHEYKRDVCYLPERFPGRHVCAATPPRLLNQPITQSCVVTGTLYEVNIQCDSGRLLIFNKNLTVGAHCPLDCAPGEEKNEQDQCVVIADNVVNVKENLGKSCPSCGNPINPATGNKFQTETDYIRTGTFPLRFNRYYNSNDAVRYARLGQHWRSNYSKSIIAYNDTVVEAFREDGKVFIFKKDAGAWTSNSHVTSQLVELLDTQNIRTGWQYTTPDNMIESYDVSGKLHSITNLAGQTQVLDYELTVAEGGDDNSETLDRVTDPYGRTLSFSYDDTMRLESMTDPDNRVYSYQYSTDRNLMSVTYPDDTPGDSNDNPTRSYHYEDTNFIHALTGITNENGERFVSWGYDTEGRAIYSEHANGAERVDLVYNADGSTSTTDSNGQVQTYHFEVQQGAFRVNQIDGDICVTCGSQSKSTTYDANGFVASRTDFNNNVTTYINDARGLELSRTEAVGTPEERTITTEWHADFRLPIKITEPGKIVTFTYDSEGRLLERKEEPIL
jgi:YD repeat-containing protein